METPVSPLSTLSGAWRTRSILLAFLFTAAFAPAACERLDTENVLILGNGAEPKDLDPHRITGVPEFNIARALFEGLVELDPSTLEPAPGVAKSWDTSPDGKIYTFHLRKNAKWSNGDPLTARDFAYSWQRVLMPGLASRYAYLLYGIRNAKAFNEGALPGFSQVGIKVLNPLALEVTLENPTPYFLLLLNTPCFMPVHRATIERFGRMDDPDTRWIWAGNLVGNGPFALERWEPDRLLRAARNPHYWDAASVRLKGIHFLPVDSAQTEERMFRTGQVHKTSSLLPSKIAPWRARKDGTLRIEPYLGTYYLKVNVTRPPLNDPRVRLALAMAIDRESICRDILKGGQQPAMSLTPPAPGGYTARAGIPYDVEKARKILAEAGYPDGRGFPAIEYMYNTQEQHRVVAEAVQDMWKNALNIHVTLVNHDWKVYQERLQGLDYCIARGVWIGDYLDPTTFLDCMRSNSGNNNTGFASAEYEALLDEGARTGDAAKRLELLRRAEAILMKEAPVMPIYNYSSVYLMRPEVKGWEPNILHYVSYKRLYLEKEPGKR